MKMIDIFILILFLTISGCWQEDDDDFKYYESSYVDTVAYVVPLDSVHIEIIQSGLLTKLLDTIPHQIVDDAGLGDTIRMVLSVNFGNSSPTPSPYEDISLIQDTLRLVYSSAPLIKIAYLKENEILEANTSPALPYYSIQNVVVFKPPDKFIWFNSSIHY